MVAADNGGLSPGPGRAPSRNVHLPGSTDPNLCPWCRGRVRGVFRREPHGRWQEAAPSLELREEATPTPLCVHRFPPDIGSPLGAWGQLWPRAMGPRGAGGQRPGSGTGSSRPGGCRQGMPWAWASALSLSPANTEAELRICAPFPVPQSSAWKSC